MFVSSVTLPLVCPPLQLLPLSTTWRRTSVSPTSGGWSWLTTRLYWDCYRSRPARPTRTHSAYLNMTKPVGRHTSCHTAYVCVSVCVHVTMRLMLFFILVFLHGWRIKWCSGQSFKHSLCDQLNQQGPPSFYFLFIYIVIVIHIIWHQIPLDNYELFLLGQFRLRLSVPQGRFTNPGKCSGSRFLCMWTILTHRDVWCKSKPFCIRCAADLSLNALKVQHLNTQQPGYSARWRGLPDNN